MRLFLPFSFMFCAWAQSGIEVPAIGAIVDPSGALRPVEGVAGSFLLGPAAASGVLSAACSERLCLAKTDSKILSATGETESPPGPALFGLEGNQAIAYFPQAQTFARWHDDTLDPLDWAVTGEVLSLRVGGGGETDIAVRRDGSVWIVHPDGSVIDWIADDPGPVLLLNHGVLFAKPDEIVFRHADAGEVRFALPGADAIAAMGPSYAMIHAGDSTYALRTESGHEQLFQLPGTTP